MQCFSVYVLMQRVNLIRQKVRHGNTVEPSYNESLYNEIPIKGTNKKKRNQNKPHDARCWRELSLSFLYLEKTTEHDFSTDISIFHLISHCSISLVPLFVINEECN
ncbi:hypothetical protein BpHYR1_019560 [Brachionus plicatilis]|uniref:Uncharacterized protein n=1 Tax=Brachionus plicatilis TaxID=10195 RepID=A0A3M7Q2R7_BRAPC|nr:hypothetical protein BpHYR1_019560 [Brachionus plicatilis]